MSFLINGLITLAIVLFFFIAYHKFTANNRSLEKVKRLADKLQNELSEYVASRAEELKHYGIDLDVQQKAAKIALEKLQAAQTAVSEKAEAIGAIADRFKEYDEVLAKLMDMTARVDQNLARIHEDENFAEGVNRKLDLAKKSLSAIEREMPLLREGFAQDAKKTVENFRDSILAELQEGLDSAIAELNSVRDEATAAFTKAQSARAAVDEELEKALETAKDRASSIEDAAFATLKDAFEKKLQAVEDVEGNQLSQLGQDTAQHIAELSSAIETFKTDWREEAEGMLSDMTAKLGEAEAIFAKKTEDVANLLQKSSEEADSSAAKLSADAEKAKSEVDGTLKELRSLEGALKASMEEAKTRIEEEFAGFGQAFEDHRTRFEANFQAETAALGDSLAKLKAEIEALKASAYENAAGKLEGFEDGLLTELSEKKSASFKKLDGWLSDMEKTLAGIVAEEEGRRKAEEAKRLEEFRSHMVKVRDEIHAQLDKMGKNIEAVRDGILEQQAEAEKELAALSAAKAATLEPPAGEEEDGAPGAEH